MTRTYADAVTDQRIRARAGRPYPERITTALDLHGLEGPEVDIACGAVEPAVDRWEAGEEIPTMEQLQLLGELTGFPVGFFFIEPEPRLDDAVFICAVDPAGGSIQLNGPEQPEQPEQLPLMPSPTPSFPVPKPDTPPPGPLPECSGPCGRPMRRTTWARQHGRCSRCGPARSTT